MQVYKQVLSAATLEWFRQSTISKFEAQCWSFSSSLWSKDILRGVVGECMTSRLDDDLKAAILKEIVHLLPQCSEYTLQHYIWCKNSGISKHDDAGHKFGATIYMNSDWDINYGGIFLWRRREETDQEMKLIVPEFNSMILNTDHSVHMVTSVSALAPDYRVTLQIWGD